MGKKRSVATGAPENKARPTSTVTGSSALARALSVVAARLLQRAVEPVWGVADGGVEVVDGVVHRDVVGEPPPQQRNIERQLGLELLRVVRPDDAVVEAVAGVVHLVDPPRRVVVEQLLASERIDGWMRMELLRRNPEALEHLAEVRVAAEPRVNAVIVTAPPSIASVAATCVRRSSVHTASARASLSATCCFCF